MFESENVTNKNCYTKPDIDFKKSFCLKVSDELYESLLNENALETLKRRQLYFNLCFLMRQTKRFFFFSNEEVTKQFFIP